MHLRPAEFSLRGTEVLDTQRRHLTGLGATALGGVYLRLAARVLPGASRVGPTGAMGTVGRNATAAPAAPPQRLTLFLEPQGWGSATVPDIEAVLQSVASVMLSHAADLTVRPLRIRHASDLPRHVCSTARASGEQVIHLAVRETRWAQFTYQFAHELFHELSNAGYICAVGARDPHRWLEESMGEVASLFALRQMAVQWRERPPYPNWRSYATQLEAYADDLLRTPHRQLPSGTSFTQWFQVRLPHLLQNGWDRPSNELIANQWLPVFERYPAAWEAVAWLNRRPQPPTVQALFKAWADDAPRRHRAFIRQLSDTVGISVR